MKLQRQQKKCLSPKVIMMAISACCIFSMPAMAEDKPKSFELGVTFHASTTRIPVMLEGKDNGVAWHGDFSATNDKGHPYMNNMHGKCGGFNLTQGEAGEQLGACVYQDKEGDKIYETFGMKEGKPIISITGGSGKFAGITCEGVYEILSFTEDFTQIIGKKTASCTRS